MIEVCPLTNQPCKLARIMSDGLVCELQANRVGKPYVIKEMVKCPKE
jgi:hypothetical protein